MFGIPSATFAKMWPFGSSNVAAGPSNMDLYRDMQSKDAEFKEMMRTKDAEYKEMLQRKDAEFKEMLHAKDAELQRKDGELRELHADKEKLLHQATEVRIMWAKANDIVLSMRGQRNVRGALEYIAGDLITDGGGGVQAKLTRLAENEEFMAELKVIAEKKNLRLVDIKHCLNHLYHTYSKGMHGSEAVVTIHVTALTATTELALLMALFERFNVTYRVSEEWKAPETPALATEAVTD